MNGSSRDSGEWPSIEFRAMGTDCLIAVEPSDDRGERLRFAKAEVERLESKFSRFRGESELSRLNRDGGGEVSVEFGMLLEAALDFAWETGGRFDPTMAIEISAAGYDRDFSELPHLSTAGTSDTQSTARRGEANPAMGEIRRPRWREIEFDGERLALPSGVGLDFGGIAKGWSAQRVAERFSVDGGVLVDLGGDCAVASPGPDGGDWVVAVDHGEGDLVTLALTEGALCTSTTRLRRWASKSGEAHHLLSPETGRPAQSDLVSVTVYDHVAARAEAWAKAILVAGLVEGLAEAEAHGVEAIATGKLGGIYTSGEVFFGVEGSREVPRILVDASSEA